MKNLINLLSWTYSKENKLIIIILVLAVLLACLIGAFAPLPAEPKGLPYDREAFGFPLTSGYWAKRDYGLHHSWDIAIPEGTAVYSLIEGTAYVKANKQCGLSIIVQNDTWRVGYYHLLEPVTLSGKQVRRGDLVGFSGNSGSESRGAHLHYFIEKFDGKKWIRVNPNDYVK